MGSGILRSLGDTCSPAERPAGRREREGAAPGAGGGQREPPGPPSPPRLLQRQTGSVPRTRWVREPRTAPGPALVAPAAAVSPQAALPEGILLAVRRSPPGKAGVLPGNPQEGPGDAGGSSRAG